MKTNKDLGFNKLLDEIENEISDEYSCDKSICSKILSETHFLE